MKSIQKIFLSALEIIRPDRLVINALHRTGNRLVLKDRSYDLKQNVNVIGFGKAVYGERTFYYLYSHRYFVVFDLLYVSLLIFLRKTLYTCFYKKLHSYEPHLFFIKQSAPCSYMHLLVTSSYVYRYMGIA